jgi:SsrA-binding protein
MNNVKSEKPQAVKIVAQNRKARHDYHILDTWEAGLVLVGTEVKSVRLGRVNLKDSYARFSGTELFLYQCHISPYEQGGRWNHDPLRTRKLLLTRREIRKLTGKVEERGLTLIPLKVYFKKGFAKIELALAKGKKQYDRREDLAKRDAEREMERAYKRR